MPTSIRRAADSSCSFSHHDYSAAALEAALGEHFTSISRTALGPSGRVLYAATTR